ncbi:SAM-dependent methyltransferase [Pseudonocardia sp. ICBG1142]|uniref:SAM-dependent methyltransferase n=1 Tax=Pseudonocardia sp. ICBG1142 TaxID=2846760 RepID=UPI0027E05B96|nr:SAM-dependent methyltransferase [Pseudonocardia sp. ICBG1142]
MPSPTGARRAARDGGRRAGQPGVPAPGRAHLCAQGIRQFLDLGSGIPTVGNVHEVAATACDDARVLYVDNDPIAVAHSRACSMTTRRRPSSPPT